MVGSSPHVYGKIHFVVVSENFRKHSKSALRKKKQQSTSDRGVGRQLTVPGPHSGRLALFVASLVVCCESRVQNTVVAADDRDFYLITKRQVARNVQKCYDTVERKAVAFFKRFTRNPPMR
jgi:hypothetical protein